MDIAGPSNLPLPPLTREGGALSPAAVAALCEHPQFAAAMRALLADNVRLYRGNRVLNYVGYDRGRLIVGFLALYLHVGRRDFDPGSGLTAQRLKALCVEQDVCSPGRARAMLSLLQLFGYLERASGDQHHVRAGDGPQLAGGISPHLIALRELQEEQFHFLARFLSCEGEESVSLAPIIMGRHLRGSRDAALFT